MDGGGDERSFFTLEFCSLHKFSFYRLNASHCCRHKVLTCIEYRAVSGIFRTIETPPPPSTQGCVLPRTKRGGVHTHCAVRGWAGGQYFGRRLIGLLQYNPSTTVAAKVSGTLPLVTLGDLMYTVENVSHFSVSIRDVTNLFLQCLL